MAMVMAADRNGVGRKLTHMWSECVGAGRANEGLRANWLEHLRLAVDECGFKYLRFHGLFHDDMFVYRERDGKGVYNWQYIDELFDRMLEIGIRPFVELGFCPGPMARRLGSVFWWKGHGAPPKDLSKWAELVERFARHCVERYGLDEVRRWYFEVWNEPNLDFFFGGTRSEYFEVYRTSALAIKKVDAQLRVGGPATSNFVADGRFDGEQDGMDKRPVEWDEKTIDQLTWTGVWVEEFLKYCAKEKVPLDFVSAHPYPTDFPVDTHGVFRSFSRSVHATAMDCQWLKDAVARSAFPNAEVHCTEWSTSPSDRDMAHDYLPAAAFIVRTNLETKGSADSLSYWVFSDVFEENGPGDSVLHGGFGMITFQGIVKPSFHAYRMLHDLGDEELNRGEANDGGWITTRDSRTGKLRGLAYHYPEELTQSVPMCGQAREKAEAILATGKDMPLKVEWTGLKPGTAVMVETLDQENGFAVRAWQEMGMPEPPTREQVKVLREKARATKKEMVVVGAGGKLVWERPMTPWSLVAVREM